jgi:hypothetical protein
MKQRKLEKGDKVIIHLWTDTQSAKWTHEVTLTSKTLATLDNGDQLLREVKEDGTLTTKKVRPLFAVYGEGLVNRSYTLEID